MESEEILGLQFSVHWSTCSPIPGSDFLSPHSQTNMKRSVKMKRRKVALYGLIWLATVSFLIQPVFAVTHYVPDDYPTIQAAVDAASAGDTIIVRNGTYTETVEVNKSLILKGEGMPVVDAGGSGNSTILVSAEGCTIKGFKVIGSSGSGGWYENDAGIKVQSSNNVIENNIASNNDRGIVLYQSSNNILSGNEASDNNMLGIYLYYSRNNTMRQNLMTNNPNNFGVWTWTELADFCQDIDTSNTVNGKPIYYLVDENDLVIDSSSNAGCVVVVNSTNIVVRDLTLSNNLNGVLFAYTQDSRIENITASHNSEGIWLQYSSNNTLTGNNVSNNGHGICLWDSGNNTLRANTMIDNSCNFGFWSGSELSHFFQDIDTSNTVDGKPIYYLVDKNDMVIDSSSNAGYVGVVNSTNIVIKDLTLMKNQQGILFAWTENSKIKNVTVSNNADGIWLQHSSNNTLMGNEVSNNFEDYGIYMQFSNNNTLKNNSIQNNNGGIIIDNSSNNIIRRNNIFENNEYGMCGWGSSNNNIYLNNFIDNNQNVCSYGLVNLLNSPHELFYDYKGYFYRNYIGNYWDDYTGSDANNDGIGDTPYSMDLNNDEYPLMEPFDNYLIPFPDIKANDSIGPLYVDPLLPVDVTVALSPDDMAGVSMDWWIGAFTSFGTYWFTYPSGAWVPSSAPICVGQIGLFDLPPYPVLTYNLPTGIYTFFFILDKNVNGVLDELSWYDYVNVFSSPDGLEMDAASVSSISDDAFLEKIKVLMKQ